MRPAGERHKMDREKIAGITPEQIRAFRLRAHHLDRKLPPGALEAAASVGGAVVSFMLRPCAFRFRVVFGARDGIHPTFTSFRRWTGHMPAVPPDAEKRLVQKFLHAHGPADVSAFGAWLGCCPQQAKRLWQTAAAEMEPVRVAGRTRYVLAEDLEALRAAGADADAWRLLGPHDPYLDFRDRALLLEDVKRQRAVWQTVSNPGVLLRGGRVAGVWRQKLQKTSVAVEMTLFESADAAARERLEAEAAQYAAFRGVSLRACTFRAEA